MPFVFQTSCSLIFTFTLKVKNFLFEKYFSNILQMSTFYRLHMNILEKLHKLIMVTQFLKQQSYLNLNLCDFIIFRHPILPPMKIMNTSVQLLNNVFSLIFLLLPSNFTREMDDSQFLKNISISSLLWLILFSLLGIYTLSLFAQIPTTHRTHLKYHFAYTAFHDSLAGNHLFQWWAFIFLSVTVSLGMIFHSFTAITEPLISLAGPLSNKADL